ncbi:RNA polymerase factor sigma-54 [Psychrobacter sp. DM4]|uniref:RNA polymerase factor sigma-54 n=1 Tax=Psychrobacter sp. DM4 TaxID=3440637 RepID=UPI003F4FB85E
MSMSFGLATSLGTSQKLTPQMQQAIKLLQLSSLELAQEVQIKLDSNPLLERIEEEEEEFERLDDMTDGELSESLSLETWNQTSLTSDKDESKDSNADDFGQSNDSFDDNDDSFASDNYDSGNYASGASSGSSTSQADFDEMDRYQGSTHATIQDHVRWQLNFKRLSSTDALIAQYLIDSMDDMGFVRLDIDDLLQSFETMASFYQWDEHVEYDEILAVLRIIQSCDPLGVGACNLSECLAIQLSKLDKNTEYLQDAQALLTASEYLVSNNIKALIELTGLPATRITPALELLRTLNPAPGLSFQSDQPDYTRAPDSYDIPDVLVTPVRQKSTQSNHTSNQNPSSHEQSLLDEDWQVRLNPETLPKLRVNREYASLVKRGDDSPDNQYLRENLTDARLFIRSIEERNQNLLKVATSIIRRQQGFLRQGATAMQPLILKDIAEEVELHESTVSRLTTSKSILTPQGLFSLKHFFSSHVSSSEGDISSTAISAMIKQLIMDENLKKPLSDSRIQTQLSEQGIEIARRTVAKYREAMNIGSSTQRKQKY